MANHHELLVSACDAGTLALMLGERRRNHALEAAAADALGDLLMEARLVPDEALPADRVAMGSRVSYEERPGGARRSVTLVYPVDSDPAQGRISVLSPIGLALLGRAPGALAVPAMPDGRALKIRVLALERAPLKEAA
ncbi:MAG: GreA/GreB family elongation factor [Burkholderiales bacterium]